MTMISPKFGALIVDRDAAKAQLGEKRYEQFDKSLKMLEEPQKCQQQVSFSHKRFEQVPSQIEALEKAGFDVLVTTGKQEIDGDEMNVVSLSMAGRGSQEGTSETTTILAKDLKDTSLVTALKEKVEEAARRLNRISSSLFAITPEERKPRRGCL